MTSSRRRWIWTALPLLCALGAHGLTGCSGDEPQVSRETRRAAQGIDEQVGGTFLEYYAEVVNLSIRYGAEPDSFRAALDALPGSHLTEEEWAAWTAPFAEDAAGLVRRLDEATAAPAPRGS